MPQTRAPNVSEKLFPFPPNPAEPSPVPSRSRDENFIPARSRPCFPVSMETHLSNNTFVSFDIKLRI